MEDQITTIPIGWKMTTLGGVISSGLVSNHNNKRYPLAGGERLRRQGIYPYYGAASAIDYIDDYKYDGFYLLVAEDGTVYDGKSPMLQLVNGKFWVSNHSHVLQGKDENTTRFLLYILKNVCISPYITGAVQPKLTKENLYSISFLIPENEMEQRDIALVLSSLDDKIELLREQNKTLESTAQAIFKEWFVNFNFPGASGKMIDSELGQIPEGWRAGELAELVEIKNGFAFKSEDYINDKQYPIIRTMNFEDSGCINSESLVYISNKKAEEYKSFNFDEYDLCVVMVGASLGKTAMVYKINLPALQNQNMWCFKPKNKNYRFYNNFQVLDLINLNIKSASGSARDFFRKDHFYAIDVLIPSESLIIKFEEIGLPIHSKISNNLSQLHTLSTLRDTLLPKLMKGEVRVGGFNN